jgi:hypothetical protein
MRQLGISKWFLYWKYIFWDFQSEQKPLEDFCPPSKICCLFNTGKCTVYRIKNAIY